MMTLFCFVIKNDRAQLWDQFLKPMANKYKNNEKTSNSKKYHPLVITWQWNLKYNFLWSIEEKPDRVCTTTNNNN